MDGIEVKRAVDIIGEWGPWQRNLVIFFTLTYVISPFQNMGIVFFAPKIDYWCADRYQNDSSVATQLNFTLNSDQIENSNETEVQTRIFQPASNTTIEASIRNQNNECFQFKDRSQECEQWVYDLSFYKATIISEWDLVCHRSWLVSASASAYQIGYILSSIIFGYISDKYGRLKSFKTAMFLEIIAGFSQAYSFSIYHFMISRLILGLAASGRFMSGFLLILECVGGKYRSQVSVIVELGIGYLILPGVAYLVPHFRYLQLIATIYEILLVLYLYKVPESPRWQLTHSKFHEAEKSITRAAKINGKLSANEVRRRLIILEEYIKQEDKRLKKARKQSIFSMWKIPLLLMYSLVLYFTWFANAFVYYGLSLNLSDLGGNLFLNTFIYALAELVSHIFLYFALIKFKRRPLFFTMMIIAGIMCLAIAPILWLKWSVAIRITLAMIGKFCNTSTYRLIYLQTAEIIPTTVRQIGVGACTIAGRIGSIIAPFVKELASSLFLSALTHPALSMLLFGFLSILDGFLGLLLPETKGVDIPDTIEEAANQKRKTKSEPSETVISLKDIPNSTN